MIEIACRNGEFGEIRIKERLRDGARLYCIGDGVHTMSRDGTSLFGYVHAMKLLLAGADNVLMIGGGGGSLATMLARQDRKVTVVDIDPAAKLLAREYFGLDPRVTWITEDAETFLTACTRKFDAIVIDACDAFGLIEAFATPVGLVNAMKHLTPGGSLVLNVVGYNGSDDFAWQLACAMRRIGCTATLFRPDMGTEGNELLHLREHGEPASLELVDIEQRPEETHLYLTSLRAFVPRVSRPIDVSRRAAL